MSFDTSVMDYLRISYIDLARVESLLNRYEGNINDKNPDDGFCALLYAVRNPNCNFEVIELLLKNGVNVNDRNISDGLCTALLYAVQDPSCNFGVIELLLRNGADVTAINLKDGRCNALIYAVRNPNCNFEVIELLLRNGVNVNAYDKNLCNPLFYAIQNRDLSLELVELLLQNGADVHQCECTALLSAVTRLNIHPALVGLILKYAENAHDILLACGQNCTACLEALKYIVLEQVRKNPNCLNNLYSCKSVLGNMYFDLFSPHFHKESLNDYVRNCFMEIRQMENDQISPLLIPSSAANKMSFGETRAVIRKLLKYCSDDNYQLYSEIIKSAKSKDVLNCLENFCIHTRSSLDGVEKATSLDWASTLLVVEYITLKDMVHLASAFYGLSELVFGFYRKEIVSSGTVEESGKKRKKLVKYNNNKKRMVNCNVFN